MASSAARERFLGHPGRVAAAVGLLAFAVFVPAVACDFVNWDDNHYVYENPLVLGGLTGSGIRRAFTDVVFNNWAPLTILSYQFDASLFGTAPWGFHLSNVVVHAVSTGLLYLVLFRMTGAAGRSAAATVLWAVHPLRVESVAWIAERKDVLSVLFLMLSLLAYDWYCRRPSASRYLWVASGMVGSLLCKPTLVTLPVLLLLLDVWPLGRLSVPWLGGPERGDGEPSPYPSRPWRRVLAEKIPLLVLSLLFVVVTLRTQGDVIESGVSRPLLAQRIPNAVHATAWYLAKTFWPSSLHPVHVHPEEGLSAWLVSAAGAVIAVITFSSAWRGRKQPYLIWGVVWFLTALLPMLGIVQTGFQAHAERFTYVPHIGLFAALVWLAAAAARRFQVNGRILAAALGAGSLGLIAGTEWQIQQWRTADILWDHVLALEPENSRALGQYGHLMSSRGRTAEAENFYVRSISCGGSLPGMLIDLARIRFAAGDFASAREYRDWAIRKSPQNLHVRRIAAAMSGLDELAPRKPAGGRPVRPDVKAKLAEGMTAARAADFVAALAAFREAIRLDPQCGSAHNNAGLACSELGRKGEAEKGFRMAIELEPDNPDYHINMAQLLSMTSRWAEALLELETALRLRPADAEARALLKTVRQRAADQR